MSEKIIIDGVNVAECGAYKNNHCKDKTSIMFCDANLCSNYPYCYYKQLKRLQAENEKLKEENKKLKYFLSKIRDDELYSMDVEWDDYITECGCTEYSNIITFVELALGERNE